MTGCIEFQSLLVYLLFEPNLRIEIFSWKLQRVYWIAEEFTGFIWSFSNVFEPRTNQGIFSTDLKCAFIIPVVEEEVCVHTSCIQTITHTCADSFSQTYSLISQQSLIFYIFLQCLHHMPYKLDLLKCQSKVQEIFYKLFGSILRL